MVHDDEPPPPTANLRSRMLWFRADITERRDRYTPASLAHVRNDSIALALAAGAPDEHRLLAELAAARTALANGDTAAEARLIKLGQKLLAAVQQINADLPNEIYRAQGIRASNPERNLR